MNCPWRCPVVPLIGTTVPKPPVNWPSAFVLAADVKPVVVGLGRISRLKAFCHSTRIWRLTRSFRRKVRH